jgi:hypothetical protein
MRTVVEHITSELGYRVLPWIDDFLCAPTDGRRPAIGRDCRRARIRLDSLFGELGLTRHPDKGRWEGAQVLEHLGVLIDMRQMRVFVTERKVLRMRKMAIELLLCAQRNRRLVSMEKVSHICGVAVSLTLAFPMARFYTRSLYWDMSLAWLRAGERGQSHTRPSARTSLRLARAPGLPLTLPERRSAQCSKWMSAPGDGELTWQHHRAPEPRWDKVRLSRQSLRDLEYWRSLTRGEGRDLHPPPADLTMHSDAADVGYGGTLGMESEAGSPGLWEGPGLWATTQCGAYHSSRVEGGALVVTEALRIVRGCRGDQADSTARGQPSLHAHPQRYGLRLSPDDGGAPAPRSNAADSGGEGGSEMDSQRREPLRGCVVAPVGPGGRLCYGGVSGVSMQRVRAGRSRLSVPPGGGASHCTTQVSRGADGGRLGRWAGAFMESSVRHVAAGIEEDGGRASAWRPDRSTVAGAAVVRAFEQTLDADARPGSCPHVVVSRGPAAAQPLLGARCSRDRTVAAWSAVIRDAVLTRTGASATGGARVAADLLSQQCWSGNTWATRSSQRRKWVGFCEQDERSVFPASEGDVLAYIEFLRLEGSVSAASLPQYLSAVSRYHELAGVASPTKTELVRSLVQAYSRAFDLGAVARPMRVGLPAGLVRLILVLGLETPVPTLVRDAALVLFMFLFGCRASTAVGVRGSDLEVTDVRATAVLIHRKGKRTQDLLVLDYDRNPEVDFASSPLALLRRWSSMRPTSDEFFPSPRRRTSPRPRLPMQSRL